MIIALYYNVLALHKTRKQTISTVLGTKGASRYSKGVYDYGILSNGNETEYFSTNIFNILNLEIRGGVEIKKKSLIFCRD